MRSPLVLFIGVLFVAVGTIFFAFEGSTAQTIAAAIALAGTIANFIVMLANHGKFPILLSDQKARNFGSHPHYIHQNQHTKLAFLSDRFYLLGAVYSIDDLVLFAGIFILLLTIF